MGIYTEAVQKLYVAYFSRPADAAGLTYWENVVTKANGNTAAVSAAFAASQEYKDTFAGQSAYQVVNTIYQNLFGRPAEAAALTFWGQGLLNGSFTIDNAVTAIAAGAQSTDLVAYNSKVAAATAFTVALDTPGEILGYSGTAANTVAKNWLAGVTTAANLATAIEATALNNTINAVTNPPVIGGTFTLTAGVDTIVGTSANDTINALSVSPNGTAGDTITAFDKIDGGAGTDTLNIYTTATENDSMDSSVVVTNVETINIYNTGAAANIANAANFSGVTQLWQIGASAAAVTGLASTTTAGFDGTTSAISVTGNSSNANVAIALKSASEASAVTVAGSKLAGVTLTGTVADTNADKTVGSLAVGATAGTDVTTFAINSAVAATVTVANGNKTVTTVDASASTGKITHNAAAGVTTLRGGSAADTLTINTATVAAATGVTAVTATVEGGAGGDTIVVKTTGDGATTVDAGAGDDKVTITTRGSGKLTVNLGDGADTFTAAVAVAAGDVIDAGAGIDTLALSLVGAANIGAFSNFDVFDAKGLNRTLDVDILSSKNTVTEFVASGDVGAATLTNIGAGVGVRITADMAGSTLTANQKTAGAITVTVDADEAGTTGNNAAELVTGAINTNAASVKAVFDTSYLADTTAEKALGATADNYTTLSLTATAATSMEVVSGGTNASNNLNIAASDKLTTVTITGTQSLTIGTVTGATKLATIDGSAHTGGLIVGTDDVANGGLIRLGTGVDAVTVASSSTPAAAERVVNFEKAIAAAVGSDATAAAAAQADADTLVFANGAVAADVSIATGDIENGVLTFTGAGPADLAAAFAIADAAASVTGDVVVFEYLGNTYVFQQGAVAGDAVGDVAIQLVGVTGVTELGEVGTTNGFFLV